ncbi:MAG: hypothetical protein WD716_01855 [Fimbriimonadaceae bacterium]
MPTTDTLAVKNLKLDLRNFRTTPQADEQAAITAMVSINADWFWALVESLLTDGYHPTENIIVIKEGSNHKVREGNRRVAALKLIFGWLDADDLPIPSEVLERIKAVSKEWKEQNKTVPCAIYEASEEEKVDKIVSLVHGKGERAARDTWTAVARARHSRDKGGVAEPALDLLEKYLAEGKNITQEQGTKWSGDYPLTVLAEAIKKFHDRFGAVSAKDLAEKYPSPVRNKSALENLMRDIGLGTVGFQTLRRPGKDIVETGYGVAPAGKPTSKPPKPPTPKPSKPGPPSYSTTDARSVTQALKQFTPVGDHREKLVALLKEARQIKVDSLPHAFCFLLRSMYELSAKAYCEDHKADGLSTKTPNGEDEKLAKVLRSITKHLIEHGAEKKKLQGAMSELNNANGFLSVRSMNELIHNPNFTVAEKHVCTVFHNIFPLLVAMSK